MALEQKVKQILSGALGPMECHLETSAAGRVGGVIVATAFDGRSQTERQEMIWAELRRRLLPDELVQVMALLTMTPAETSDLDAVIGASA